MNILEYKNYRETKSHGDAEFPYNTYLCSIPLDFQEVPIHWHNEMELIYIKKGCGIVSLDFETQTVRAGDIVVVIPGQLHGISTQENASMEYENIIFSVDMLLSRQADRVNSEFLIPLLSGNISFRHLITPDDICYREAAGCLDRADRICSQFPVGYELALKGYLFEFLYVLCSNAEEKDPSDERKKLDKMRGIIKYVETHYQNHISIDEIAGICGYSSSHFMRFFKHATGTSFIEYLNDYRIAMAARMLLSSDNNIIDIAADCGFENLSYFNRRFKRKYGVTPNAYRKK